MSAYKIIYKDIFFKWLMAMKITMLRELDNRSIKADHLDVIQSEYNKP